MAADLGYRLTTPAVPQSLDLVHELLESAWAGHPDVAVEDRMRFEIALTEVAGNIMEHAAGGEVLDLTLLVRVLEPRLEARFEDSGPQAGVDLESATLPDDLAESGRGLALARRAVEEVAYWREGATNHWRIVRVRSPR
ncbi:serine/threonine-protein kinase RsbW [Geodermatophilus amargosae]|uniref:Serine/threonine-protein kinase RsbW n=1 Tax=Geodermatophilus amargosae TaxID=1296565 RepID=A0A1I6ZJ00_9ACTN|nr:ATP-binding protein [Geodermatophilus amargosae]SFT62613.1 serine/threonine-protein kinase RsbW [Geodermatophilus amargosae]